MYSTLRDRSRTFGRTHLRRDVTASRDDMRATLRSLAQYTPVALKAITAILRSDEASRLVKGAMRFAKRHPLVCAAAGAALIYALTSRGSPLHRQD